MHLTSETHSICSNHPHRRGVTRSFASGLIAAILLLTSGIGVAQESLLSSNDGASNDGHYQTWIDVDTWITDIGTLLYRDDDGDGYFSGFSLTIDADTYHKQTEIYASIDVQRAFGERERLHTSANFPIYGDQLSDEYRIDIDLLANYPAGDYNLYIDLHDAYDHRVLDGVSAVDFSNLYRLPLESEDLDLYNENEHDDYPGHHPDSPSAPVNADIRVVEYAGSSGFFLIMAILTIATLRKFGTCRHKCR